MNLPLGVEPPARRERVVDDDLVVGGGEHVAHVVRADEPVNPGTRIRHDRAQPMVVRSIDLDAIRGALTSDDPARAAIAALVAFHALATASSAGCTSSMSATAACTSTPTTIVLAEPVRRRLNTWLAERARRWPGTANPHLFISSRTAVRTTPVSAPWIIDTLGVLPQTIRQDRILQETIATDGDVRRLSDLFGISIATAQRYADVILKPNEQHLVDINALRDP